MFAPWIDGSLIATVLLWSAVAVLTYTYLGYPVLLWVASKVKAPLTIKAERPRSWPTVTVVISAYNEETVIGRRIENLLEQDYPRKQVEIIIGSDGSTDATCEVASQYRHGGIHLYRFRNRRGKASVLNDLVALARGEFVVFTDAATVFYPETLKQLINGFWHYPSASVIVGELEMRSCHNSGNLDGLYWRYELFLKRLQSLIGAGLGASGAIYAFRRRDYCTLPEDTIADDFLQPLLIRLRTRRDAVFYPAARAWQLIPVRVADEFRRRVRTGAGIAHVLRETWRLLLPQWGVVALALWSHKALRLLGPWLLLVALAANIALWHDPVYRSMFVLQVLFYGTALCAGIMRPIPLVGKAAVAIRYFVVLNAALAMGSLKFLFGMARPTWERTNRPEKHPLPGEAWSKLLPEETVTKQHSGLRG